ncbi:hypothetical protein F5Y15DRAFT_52678 [Xylariaceae sp. FL0016]|nr:hypothetical protein F5Y15DRAFT_52678 [Xylariaceae sp. FL0016]
MPTVHVTPTALDLLQDVADTLGKARKVVIITGAGISTNSGIPDFRSENGLYSLIQEQFERAEANAKETGNETPEFDVGDRPAKRRRLSQQEVESSMTEQPPSVAEREVPDTSENPKYSKEARGLENLEVSDEHALPSRSVSITEPTQRLTRSQRSTIRPPIPRHLTDLSAQSSASRESIFSNVHLSRASSYTDDSLIGTGADADSRGPVTRANTPKANVSAHFSSSPLSSPPPILFDPFEQNNTTSTDSSSQSSSDESDSSDTDYTQQSFDFLSSQASNPNIRNMKGRDLFDSNIWADPLKTSVFYRFATSLRQKIRDVEPTSTHRFIAQMRDIGKLSRVYTQNIDEIEKKIGLSTDLKHGAGNKRRKSAKHQHLSDVGKECKDIPESCIADEDLGSTEVVPSSQGSDEAGRSKIRPNLLQDKGVECVFLHGSLHALRCFVCGKLCDWDQDGRESRTMCGEQPECPHCAGATAARQEKGKRALGVGKLRPDIVLYGEEHPQSDLISPIVQHDLGAGPDVLLILGTSLRVHGLKVMVREFAKAVHNKGGKVVFINFTKPSESVWGDVLDYWIEWDCDAWVNNLKERKPQLWMSPDKILELEKQKKDALAEKKREALKKRESLNEKKKEILEEKSRAEIDHKPRPPPKNPSAMRNDYGCAAYVVYEIFQTLARISNRPFDNLGYIPPSVLTKAPPPAPVQGQKSTSTPADRKQIKAESAEAPMSEPRQIPKPGADFLHGSVRRRQARVKKPRKLAPAGLQSVAKVTPVPRPTIHAIALSRLDGKDQWIKAARELALSGKPPTPARMAVLNRTPVSGEFTPSTQSEQRPEQEPEQEPEPEPEHESSILTAVKSKPRQRKRKVIDGVEVGKPASSVAARSRPVLPPPNPLGFRNLVMSDQQRTIPSTTGLYPSPHLPPLDSDRSTLAHKIEPIEPTLDISPKSPLTEMHRTSRAQDSPFPVRGSNRPIIYSDRVTDPLAKLGYQANYQQTLKPQKDKTPSPSAQLREEWDAAHQLSLMRDGR